ncbi:MAG TPA: hypothetical protein VFC63_19255 [Blastocatellia bacterium]|nr:hypothetical protein [Blastocatellia bacterium]
MATPADYPTPPPQPSSPSPAPTDLNSLVGERPSPLNSNITEYFNKQNGAGFANPTDLASFLNTQSGRSDINSTNVFDVLKNNTASANASLNQGQDTAFQALDSAPPDDVATQKQKAQDIIDKATADQTNVQQELQDATTGGNDLRTQAQNYYSSLGISALEDDVANATQAYNNVKQAQLSNKLNLEQQYQGGGTTGFADALDSRDQQVLAMHELAAATALQVAQQRLNSQMDVFKVFNQAATDQQTHVISNLSQQLGLDKADLQFGVNLLNQVQTEVHGDETAARQFIATLATNNPDVFSQLTPQDQQDLSQGKVTPAILAKIGQAANLRQQRNDIAQQQANIAAEREAAYASRVVVLNNNTGSGAGLYGSKDNTEIQNIISKSNDWGSAAAALDNTFGPGTASLYDTQLKVKFQIPADITSALQNVPSTAISTATDWQQAHDAFVKAHSYDTTAADAAFKQAYGNKPSNGANLWDNITNFFKNF